MCYQGRQRSTPARIFSRTRSRFVLQGYVEAQGMFSLESRHFFSGNNGERNTLLKVYAHDYESVTRHGQ